MTRIPESSNHIQALVQQMPTHLHERVRILEAFGKNPDSGRPVATAGRGPDACECQGVVYWTHHALRTDENPALDVARILASRLNRPLLVYQGISEKYRFASDRHHTFMIEGARDLQRQYQDLGIRYAFHLQRAGYREPILHAIADLACLIVTDDFPLEPTKIWLEHLQAKGSTPIVCVDTSCVVPWQMVGKKHTRAFAFRDATKQLYEDRIPLEWPECNEIPKPFGGDLPFEPVDLLNNDLSIADLVASCDIDHSIGPVGDTRGGSEAGYQRWDAFRNDGLKRYARRRNDAAQPYAVSRMSAYLHYGMVSPMRLAREAHRARADKYLDELLIWREMAFGFCQHTDDVDSLNAIPDWARETLQRHADDPRRELRTWEQMSRADTGDRLWDACQESLLRHGELHNNLRMTWGKAIPSYTRSPSMALRQLIDLNHRYALDGRDPSSYGGLLWCLGQFDRPFSPEQPIVGSVRPRSTRDHLARISIEDFEKHVQRPRAGWLPRVAFVGAGLAGLMAARTLADQGISVQLFEKSRGRGGRSATRRMEVGLQFDHGAQYITVRDQRLANLVRSWLEAGLLAPWSGRVVEVHERQVKEIPNQVQRYVAIPSMSAIGRHLAGDLPIQCSTLVTGITRVNDEWFVASKDRIHGPFDVLICNAPPDQTRKLVIDHDVNWLPALNGTRMDPCYSVMVAWTEKWQVPFDGAFLSDSTPFRWIARDSSKIGRPQDLDCWVLHASTAWSRENLERTPDEVADLLIRQLPAIDGVKPPERLFAEAHRWRFAEASGAIEQDCLWDPQNRIGACGDWCRASRMEGALLSGMSMAGRIMGWLHESFVPDERPVSVQQKLFADL